MLFIFFRKLTFITYPKDVIPIRHKRTKKYKTPFKKWKLLCQLMAIWYATTITSSFIDGSTGAYFNDQDQVTGVITAGTWSIWDKSSLKFPDEQDRTIKACSPLDISARISNTGSTMQGTTEYEVYYAAKGNPKNGSSILNGDIQPIAENETTTLTAGISQPGNYKFKALQRPGHGNKEDTRHELWSETITITCEQDTPKDEDKGGGKNKPEPPKKKDKQEKQDVTVPEDTTKEQGNEDVKEEPAPPVEETPEPEQPKATEEPAPEAAKQPEATTASEQEPSAPQGKDEETVESSATNDKKSE
jgi:YqxM protein